MRTRIISAFPGTGKSYFCKNNPLIALDSDSSGFSWVKDDNGNNTKVRNPNFPQNYINHIKENIGKYEFIFVSSHENVREALKDNCLFYYFIYPNINNKVEYLKRYSDRGNEASFVTLLDKNWDTWVHACSFDMYGCSSMQMVFPYLSEEIICIVASENGDMVVTSGTDGINIDKENYEKR